MIKSGKNIFVLGVGSIGASLAAYLDGNGKNVVAVKTSSDDTEYKTVNLNIKDKDSNVTAAVINTVSLSRLEEMDGIIVVCAKSYANAKIASRLRNIKSKSPIVVLQNGLNVEQPYCDLHDNVVYRCVLYSSCQNVGGNEYSFVKIKPSPVGIIQGSNDELNVVFKALHSENFPFCIHDNIHEEVWKKVIINAVYNSICPLLDVDMGIFARDPNVTELAREIVSECVKVAKVLNFQIEEDQLVEVILTISRTSENQLISTLQDIRNGRKTEIESFNAAIAKVADKMLPPLRVEKTKLLGEMVLLKSNVFKSI